MLAQHASSSAPLEDRELEVDQKAVNMNPEAQKAFLSTPLQDRGMDAETKPSVVEVSIFNQKGLKSTRSPQI